MACSISAATALQNSRVRFKASRTPDGKNAVGSESIAASSSAAMTAGGRWSMCGLLWVFHSPGLRSAILGEGTGRRQRPFSRLVRLWVLPGLFVAMVAPLGVGTGRCTPFSVRRLFLPLGNKGAGGFEQPSRFARSCRLTAAAGRRPGAYPEGVTFKPPRGLYFFPPRRPAPSRFVREFPGSKRPASYPQGSRPR